MKRAVARWSRDDETRSRSCQKPKWTKIFENRSKSLNLACAVLDQAATKPHGEHNWALLLLQDAG